MFGGIQNTDFQYVGSFERIDLDHKDAWDLITVDNRIMKARQGSGLALLDQRNILIFGGFNNGFLKDSYCFDMVTNKITKMPDMSTEEKFESFSYQMPTAYDHSTETVYSIDLMHKHIY